jgi:16S rRNA G527 N7-methylase RsmG
MENLNETFDLVTLRAFSSVPQVWDDLEKLTASGGRIAAYKGMRNNAEEEMAGLKNRGVSPDRMELIPLKVPFSGAERHLLLINS